MFDVITEEEIDDLSEITNKPVEQGGLVSDHVERQPTYINLQGAYTGTDAPERLRELLKMYYSGNPYKYVGRNAYDNVVIKKLRRYHNRDNRLGFDFELSLQRVDIAKAETFEVKASPPKGKPKNSTGKSSKAKTGSQVKKTTTQGRQQPVSKASSEAASRGLGGATSVTGGGGGTSGGGTRGGPRIKHERLSTKQMLGKLMKSYDHKSHIRERAGGFE